MGTAVRKILAWHRHARFELRLPRGRSLQLSTVDACLMAAVLSLSNELLRWTQMSQSVYRALRTALVILFLATAFVTWAPGASGQAGLAITASPTSSPGVWTISGSGFEPNIAVRVMAIPCDDLATCALGSGAIEGTFGPVFTPVTTSPDGTFSANLNFGGATPAGGESTFMVVAFPGSRALQRTDPFTEVPASAGAVVPTPIGPPTGQGRTDVGQRYPIAYGVLGLLALVAGATILGSARLRRRG